MKSASLYYWWRARTVAPKVRVLFCLAVAALALTGGRAAAAEGTFDSGSDGSEGALSLTTPGTVVFDPVALGLDPDGDGIFHFTTITVDAGVTVRLESPTVTKPVFWLATGAVVIDGTIDMNGGAGQAGQAGLTGI